MKVIEREGDLFTTDAQAIGHGVNCAGLMGAGIAVKFREKFPEMYRYYLSLCQAGLLRPGSVYPYYTGDDVTVYNIASQASPGADARYPWLVTGVMKALESCETMGYDRLALPYIGAGIGGLDRDEVRKRLAECAEASPVDIELWDFKG